MMHTGDHYERSAREERALAIQAAWLGLRGLLSFRRPHLQIFRVSSDLPLSAGCVSRG